MRGRRTLNDEAALHLMAIFNTACLARGEQANDREASRHAVMKLKLRGTNSTADGSVEDRLRTKFRGRRDELMAAVCDDNELSPNFSQARGEAS